MNNDQIEIVIDGMSRLIMSELKSVSSEQADPMHGADASDDAISDGKVRVKKLRAIRESFEDTVSWIIW